MSERYVRHIKSDKLADNATKIYLCNKTRGILIRNRFTKRSKAIISHPYFQSSNNSGWRQKAWRRLKNHSPSSSSSAQFNTGLKSSTSAGFPNCVLGVLLNNEAGLECRDRFDHFVFMQHSNWRMQSKMLHLRFGVKRKLHASEGTQNEHKRL
uniref:Uncharacterized protein n=1 Tax=Photinus pyralis TaxID=7054 RepID=A0A1Y1N5L4_PHOPY